MRGFVVAAFVLTLSGFILGLLTLLAGSTLNAKDGFMEYAAILRYDHSTFSDSGDVIKSSTWDSLHVLSVCNGSDTQSTTCTPTRTGLDNGNPISNDGKGPTYATTGMVLIIGLGLQIGCAGLGVFFMPWMFKGMHHWNGFFVPILFIGWLGSIIAAVAGSAYSLGQTHIAYPKHAPITYSPVWIGTLWGGMFCMVIATALEHVERNFERFTPKENPISAEFMPEDVPLWIWNPWLRRAQ